MVDLVVAPRRIDFEICNIAPLSKLPSLGILFLGILIPKPGSLLLIAALVACSGLTSGRFSTSDWPNFLASVRDTLPVVSPVGKVYFLSIFFSVFIVFLGHDGDIRIGLSWSFY